MGLLGSLEAHSGPTPPRPPLNAPLCFPRSFFPAGPFQVFFFYSFLLLSPAALFPAGSFPIYYFYRVMLLPPEALFPARPFQVFYFKSSPRSSLSSRALLGLLTTAYIACLACLPAGLPASRLACLPALPASLACLVRLIMWIPC